VERRELSPQDEALYSFVLERGQCPLAEVMTQPGGEASLAHLVEFGLLANHPELPEVIAAVDPSLAVARQSAKVLEEASRNLAWLARLPQSTASLGQQYRAAQESASGVIEVVNGFQAIGQRLSSLLATCSKRMLTMHPEGHRPAEALEAALGRDLDVIGRGVEVRIMYLSPVRRQIAVQRYVEAVTAAGAGVRTLAELPTRIFVIDEVAIIPYHGSEYQSAVFIQDRSTVAALVEIFDLLWRMGEDFGSRSASTAGDQLEETHRAVIRMLLDGQQTGAIARSLGMSERTVTRLRNEIGEIFGTSSPVQLGWLLHERYPQGIGRAGA
jgi:DNA-binding CsgD family transcriptional regulator